MSIFPLKRKNCCTSPLQEFSSLHDQMDQLFNLAFPSFFGEETGLSGFNWAPSIDVVDKEKQLVIKADLPGLEKEDINVSIDEGILNISGEKKHDHQLKKDNQLVRSERYYGKFNRMIKLPASVDASQVKATFKNGVLELVLTKKDEPKDKGRKINIE